MSAPRMTTITALRRAATLSSARQRVADLRERSLLGGAFYVFSWSLIALYSEAHTLRRPWVLAGGLGLGLLAALAATQRSQGVARG